MPKSDEDLVSIAVPFYGQFARDRLAIALDSYRLQKEVVLEVVLAECSDKPSFTSKDFLPNVKYFHLPMESLVEGDFFKPGKVRNFAVKNCKGKFIYSNDGDILFQDKYFLRDSLKLLSLSKGKILLRPPMRRLPLECFEEFNKVFHQQNLEFALSKLDKTQDYIATIGPNKIKMKVFKKFESGREKTFLYTETDHKKYREDAEMGKEPVYSTLETHAGGTLMLKSQFDQVGGFCLEYAGWGCQDADLQWKLKEVFGTLQFPKNNVFEVLHLDHPKGYFSRDRWTKNREIQQRRKLQGIDLCVENDRGEYGS